MKVKRWRVALLQTLVQEHIDNDRELPRPSHSRGRKFRTIRLSAMQTAKVELYREFFAAGIRKPELARRLGVPATAIDRMLDLRHQTKLDQIEEAFGALGKEIRIDVRDAA